MKKALSVLLVVSLLFCLGSCNQNTTETIKLNSSNVNKYINIQLVFGNVEQNISENSILKTESKYLSCMCYVIISPKADYSFDNTNITFTISKKNSLISSTSLTSTWLPKGNSQYSALSDSWQQTIYLDKNGYGIASVYFEKSGNGSHPLVSSEWEVKILTTNGSIITK